jgi:hypothetical protein
VRFDEMGHIFMGDVPPPGRGWQGTINAELTVRHAIPGVSNAVAMPHMLFVCGGRIASPSRDGLQVDADGRRATITAPVRGDATDATISFEWRVGSPECDVLAYDSLIPFFVEGDAETVRLVDAILLHEAKR